MRGVLSLKYVTSRGEPRVLGAKLLQLLQLRLERLRRLAGDLDEHQQRVAAEGMTEEQLAVFDLLTRPEPDLSDTEQDQVKQVARELFSHIEEALVLDWQKTQSTRALVKVSIETHLDQLPDAYDRDLFRKKAGLIYDYVTTLT